MAARPLDTGDLMRQPQRALCEAIAAMTLELRRPPSSSELARRLGRLETNVRRSVGIARRDGWVTPWPRDRPQFHRSPIRLTARARIELGLPVVAYLAWPLPPAAAPAPAHEAARQAGADLARRVLATGARVAPVSPYLVSHGPEDRPVLDAAAAALAAQSDALLVWRDGLLLGRADLAAGVNNGAHVAVIDDEDLRSGELWRDPLRPTYPRAQIEA